MINKKANPDPSTERLNDTRNKYVFGLYMVIKGDLPMAQNFISRYCFESFHTVERIMQSQIMDDEIEMDKYEISLRNQFTSNLKFSIPVKGQSCRHIEVSN